MKSPFKFTPEVSLDPVQAPTSVAIKGALPLEEYGFTLMDIYATVPSLDTEFAYKKLRSLLEFTDLFLAKRLRIKIPLFLPIARSAAEAQVYLAVLLNPRRFGVDAMAFDQNPIMVNTKILEAGSRIRPFKLIEATDRKLLHSLVWIDTNIKLAVECVSYLHGIPKEGTKTVARAALTLYAVLLKMQDHQLVKQINFNHSMFIQDRILNLIFGDILMFGTGGTKGTRLNQVGKLSNLMALCLLRGLGDLTYDRLLRLSIFMGVVWTSRADIQRAFLVASEQTLAELEADLTSAERGFCIDHTQALLNELVDDPSATVVVVLDDNGESVFDLALFQKLLLDTANLKLVCLINRFSVSNNISLETFEELLCDPYFASLKRFLNEGRLSLCVEDQLFAAFDEAYLSPRALQVLQAARFAYIKGVNFFETFQPTAIPRFYCFTVSGMTSMMLTGCPEGSGVFARIDAGKEGYIYLESGRCVPLVDQIHVGVHCGGQGRQ